MVYKVTKNYLEGKPIPPSESHPMGDKERQRAIKELRAGDREGRKFERDIRKEQNKRVRELSNGNLNYD